MLHALIAFHVASVALRINDTGAEKALEAVLVDGKSAGYICSKE